MTKMYWNYVVQWKKQCSFWAENADNSKFCFDLEMTLRVNSQWLRKRYHITWQMRYDWNALKLHCTMEEKMLILFWKCWKLQNLTFTFDLDRVDVFILDSEHLTTTTYFENIVCATQTTMYYTVVSNQVPSTSLSSRGLSSVMAFVCSSRENIIWCLTSIIYFPIFFLIWKPVFWLRSLFMMKIRHMFCTECPLNCTEHKRSQAKIKPYTSVAASNTRVASFFILIKQHGWAKRLCFTKEINNNYKILCNSLADNIYKHH